jgi:Fur family transcriptional regulator, iron response regulator
LPQNVVICADSGGAGAGLYNQSTFLLAGNTPVNEVSGLLERHGIRPTQQRVKVAEVLLTAPVHLTAEQLLTTLRQAPSRVSKATVYNTLKLFVDHGLVRQIHLDPERCVYDSTMTPHHHFQNVETGEMRDIRPDELTLERMPALPTGTEIDGIEVVIRVRPQPS